MSSVGARSYWATRACMVLSVVALTSAAALPMPLPIGNVGILSEADVVFDEANGTGFGPGSQSLPSDVDSTSSDGSLERHRSGLWSPSSASSLDHSGSHPLRRSAASAEDFFHSFSGIHLAFLWKLLFIVGALVVGTAILLGILSIITSIFHSSLIRGSRSRNKSLSEKAPAAPQDQINAYLKRYGLTGPGNGSGNINPTQQNTGASLNFTRAMADSEMLARIPIAHKFPFFVGPATSARSNANRSNRNSVIWDPTSRSNRNSMISFERMTPVSTPGTGMPRTHSFPSVGPSRMSSLPDVNRTALFSNTPGRSSPLSSSYNSESLLISPNGNTFSPTNMSRTPS